MQFLPTLGKILFSSNVERESQLIFPQERKWGVYSLRNEEGRKYSIFISTKEKSLSLTEEKKVPLLTAKKSFYFS